MPKFFSSLARNLLIVAAFATIRASADVVVTTNGARLVGKITSVSDGVVTISTDYAGEIKVKQALVASVETDRPVAMRLANGDRLTGSVAPTTDGKLKITSGTGDSYAQMPQVKAIWAAGQEDPAVDALRRKWHFEAAVDINGENGTHEQLGTDLSFKSVLKGPDDALMLYSAYDRQVTNGEKAADQFKAGVDYSDNMSEQTFWFVRDETGFDRVNQITFSDIAAAGFGYNFVKTPDQTLTGRVGLSYRDYQYTPGADTPSIDALGADFEIHYWKKFGNAEVHDNITYLPDFQDTKSYIITHELGYMIPLALSHWKLTIGVSNNYNSEAVLGIAKLDTLYFTRLGLTWGQK
jgi:putative salt-induced outer membrane protein YdiY